MSAIDYMMCGCPAVEHAASGHRAGCWMADAEAIAAEAYGKPDLGAPWPSGSVVAIVAALAEAGYLRHPTGEVGVLALLDMLTEAELLGAPGGEPT